jgi:MFS family permease
MYFKRAYGAWFNGLDRLDHVVRLHLACKFVGALYFVYPIFYQFTSQTITPIEVGLFFSITSLCNFIADIPSSILADTYSRKAVALVGVALLTIAPFVVLLADSFTLFIVAAAFYGMGGACMNGATEALVYDHKNVSKAAFRRVNALEMTFGQAGILVSAAVGGVMFAANHAAPFVAQVLAGLTWFVLLACMREQNKAGHAKAAVSYRRHLAQSLWHLLATPYLRVLVFMGVTFSVMLGMCIQFVHEAAMIEHGLHSTARGFLISGAGFATILILNTFLLRALKSDTARILYIALGSCVAYLLMGFGGMPLFLAGYLLWCCLNITSPFIRLIIHGHIPGSHRATILSSFKALAVLVGLGGSTGTGLLVQWAHTPRVAYMLFGLIALCVLVPCAVWLVAHRNEVEHVEVQPSPKAA